MCIFLSVCLPGSILTFHKYGIQGKSLLDGQVSCVSNTEIIIIFHQFNLTSLNWTSSYQTPRVKNVGTNMFLTDEISDTGKSFVPGGPPYIKVVRLPVRNAHDHRIFCQLNFDP